MDIRAAIDDDAKKLEAAKIEAAAQLAARIQAAKAHPEVRRNADLYARAGITLDRTYTWAELDAKIEAAAKSDASLQMTRHRIALKRSLEIGGLVVEG